MEEMTKAAGVKPVDTNRLHKREFSVQWTILAVGLLVLALALFYSLSTQKEQLTAHESERLSTLAMVIDKNLVRQLDSADVALVGLRTQFQGSVPGGPEELTSERLKLLELAMPGVRSITFIDELGRARFSSRPDVVGMDLSGRRYFQEAKRASDPALLHISPPFKALSGVYVITLGRSVFKRDGSFGGLFIASLDPEFFSTLLESARYTNDMWSALAHEDGLQFLMVPAKEGQEGLDLAKPGSFFTRHRESGLKENVFKGVVYATGEDRLMALRTIRPTLVKTDKALVVAVGREAHSLYEEWNKSLLVVSILYLVVVVSSVGGLAFYHRRRLKASSEVAAAEKLAREAGEELDRFFNMSLNLLCIADMEGNFKRVNSAWSEVLGYRMEELNGRRFLDMVHPDDMDATIAAMSELSKGNPVRGFINRYRKSDGTYRAIEWHSIPSRDSLIFAVALDVTERKQLEDERERLIAELQEALARVKTLSGLLPICAWCKKIRDDKGYWNQLEQYISHYSEAEFTHGVCPECVKKIQKEELK